MLKLKKLLALTLSASVVVSLSACKKKEAPKKETPVKTLSEMTKDNITLTYAQWGNADYTNMMVQKFMEKYPNIKVEVVPLEQGTWNDGLTNLASAGTLPDAFWYIGNCDIAIRNGWLGDMTEYWENDPETDNVLTTLKDQGYFDGKRKLAAAAQYYPFTMYLDKNLFQRLNQPMPSPDWTYSEMLDLIKKMTVPEQGIFGYNSYTQLLTMAPIVNNDAWGEFGWDGKKYDLTKDWAPALQQQADFVRAKNHAPAFGSEEAAAAFGSADTWAASTGKVAIQTDAWWTIDLFATKEFTDKGINWVPYVTPKGDNAKTLHKPAFVDFGTISSATQHPREAYELLKFMGWGVDGWNARLDIFANAKNDDGTKKFVNPIGLPITNDKAIWEGVKKLLPQTEEFANFLDRAKEPIPLGGSSQPGFQTFLDEAYFNYGGKNVEAEVIAGNLKAADVAAELSEKANQYRQEALDELFAQ